MADDEGQEQKQEKKQIPCGNDKQNCKGKGNSKDKRRSRFPAGMTNRMARTGTKA